MVFYLAQMLQDAAVGTEWENALSVLRVFRYISVRSAGAAMTALALMLWVGPAFIAWLKRLKFGQNYQDRAEEQGDLKARVLSKKGTPTMGGLLIVLILDFAGLMWAQWNELVVLTLLTIIVLAALGFYDDYAKITKQSGAGATSSVKLVVQTALALFIGVYLWNVPTTSKLITEVHVPFYKHPLLVGAGAAGLVVAVLAIVGSSNLSESALKSGIEWNYRVFDQSMKEGWRDVVQGFDRLVLRPELETLSHDWIDTYEARRSTFERPRRQLAEVADEPPAPPVIPHTIQVRALRALKETREVGHTAGLVVLATGLGKTWLSAFDSADFRRVLFVAHREEILQQAMATFRRVRPNARFGLFTGEKKDLEADILFASIQTLGKWLQSRMSLLS